MLGEKRTLLVVREAFSGVRRFEDFHRRIGCARNVLSARLVPEAPEVRLVHDGCGEDVTVALTCRRGHVGLSARHAYAQATLN